MLTKTPLRDSNFRTDENGRPFTGSVKTHEDDVWEYGDNYLDGLYVSQYMYCRKSVSRPLWFTLEFDHLLRVVVVGPTVTAENIKQLRKYEGDYEGIYNLSSLCRDEPDKNLAINAHLLQPEIRISHLKAFLGYMRTHDISGQRWRTLLDEFAAHRDLTKLDVTKADTSFLDPVVNSVIKENAAKIAASDPAKITNFLVGQVMKQLKGQKVDMAVLKAKIEASVGSEKI